MQEEEIKQKLPDCQNCGSKESGFALVYGKFVCGKCYMTASNKIKDIVWG